MNVTLVKEGLAEIVESLLTEAFKWMIVKDDKKSGAVLFWTGGGWSEEYPDAWPFANKKEALDYQKKKKVGGRVASSGNY